MQMFATTYSARKADAAHVALKSVVRSSSVSPRDQRIRRLSERIQLASGKASPWASSDNVRQVLMGTDGNRDLSPSTYASIMSGFKKRKQWRPGVATLMHALEHEPHKLNAHHFAMGISACGAARNSKAAVRLLEEMGSRGVAAGQNDGAQLEDAACTGGACCDGSSSFTGIASLVTASLA